MGVKRGRRFFRRRWGDGRIHESQIEKSKPPVTGPAPAGGFLNLSEGKIKIGVTQLPGQKGTRQWVEVSGDHPACVRYRFGKVIKHMKTVL
jgi:hypothetical protein